MIKLLATFLGGWQKWAAIGAAFVALLLYVGWVKWDNATLETTIAKQAAALTEAERVNKTAAEAVDFLLADRDRVEKALAASHKDALRNAARASALAKEIERVPQSENCVVGPAARRVIDGLFGKADHPDGSEGGQAGGPGRTAVAPRRPR